MECVTMCQRRANLTLHVSHCSYCIMEPYIIVCTEKRSCRAEIVLFIFYCHYIIHNILPEKAILPLIFILLWDT